MFPQPFVKETKVCLSKLFRYITHQIAWKWATVLFAVLFCRRLVDFKWRLPNESRRARSRVLGARDAFNDKMGAKR